MPLRFVFLAAAAALAVVGPAVAKMMPFRPPALRAVTADVVVVGTVTAVEKEVVEVAPEHGAPGKVAYKVAVVKVDQPLAGANTLTHLKVGFTPPPAAAAPGRPIVRRGGTELKEGDRYVFFLTRHHAGNFYLMPFTSPPVDAKGENGKAELDEVRKGLAAAADPKAALAAAKVEDRAFAAAVLVTKYRTPPETGGETAEVPLPAGESRLILKGLAEADWKQGNRFATVSPMTAFLQLGLTPEDGWNPPRAVPGQPFDFAAATQTAFTTWLDGPGREYRVKRFVPKK
ncbi:hypothetical protein J0H58_12505 [bacterium]|nr:hypothetical protein [bacterium]